MDELKLTKLEKSLIEKLEKIDWKFKYEELYPYGNRKGLYINPFGILYYYNINGTPSRLWERLSNEKYNNGPGIK